MLKIDKEFKELIPQLRAEEFEQLEKNIIAEGIREPIITCWGNTIIDGHNRYEIAQRHELEYETIDKMFYSRDEVIAWMIDNQLGRRNLTSQDRDYLLGLRYRQEKKQVGDNQYTQKRLGQNVPPTPTAEKIAQQYNVSEKTVKRAEKFTDGVDKISKAKPEMKAEILQGKSDFTKQEVSEFAKVKDDEIEKEVERRLKEKEEEKKNRYAKVANKIIKEGSSKQSEVNKEIHEVINAKYGEVYKIKGKKEHLLIVGDSFDCDYIKSITKEIDCVLTDPPYGISYKSPSGNGFCQRGDYSVIEDDDKDFNPDILFKYSKNVITWGGNHYANKLENSAGWLIWDKRDGQQINNNSDCEMAWTNMINSARLFHHKWNGMIKDSERGEKRIHPTQKPIKLFEWCLEICNCGEKVLDLFSGSGVCLLACDNTNRTCYLVEKDEVYASATLNRFIAKGFEVVKHGE